MVQTESKVKAIYYFSNKMLFFIKLYDEFCISGIIGIHSAMKYVGITTNINYALLFDVSEKDF